MEPIESGLVPTLDPLLEKFDRLTSLPRSTTSFTCDILMMRDKIHAHLTKNGALTKAAIEATRVICRRQACRNTPTLL